MQGCTLAVARSPVATFICVGRPSSERRSPGWRLWILVYRKCTIMEGNHRFRRATIVLTMVALRATMSFWLVYTAVNVYIYI